MDHFALTAYNHRIREQLDWKWWVTPKPLRTKSIHRWYIFPHSFTSDLVHALIEEWGLGENDKLLDPFVGAGTTVLAALEKNIPAHGFDLLPLATFVTNTKIAKYDRTRLESTWQKLKVQIGSSAFLPPSKEYPNLVRRALPGRLLTAFDTLGQQIDGLDCSHPEKNFFQLALLNTIPEFSHAIATGGWLKWVENRKEAKDLPLLFSSRVETMLQDLESIHQNVRDAWVADLADSRNLPVEGNTYSAVITSPPYPNRHDYTRVFGVELMFGFLDWEETRKLRYQSIQSHPEGHPDRPNHNGYTPPAEMLSAIERITERGIDRRIPPMLTGYFLDLYLSLTETVRVCKAGSRIAFVVGNAQYKGVPFFVDTWLAEIGEDIGLECVEIRVIRFRGNSAQQMGKYGRRPSRESIVIFKKP